jgi:integrase
MKKQVLPYFGSVPLNKITNAVVRKWVSTLLSSGLSAATTRKAVFALRQCLAAAIADERLQFNPACAVPLPTERQKPPRYLSQSEVERLVDEMPHQYRALVLVGAYAGLRWGEAAGLRRRDIDPLCSRIRVTSTAVQLRGRVTLDNDPKTTRSKRSVPVARSVMRRLEQHLSEFVDQTEDAIVFTAPTGGPLFRSWGRTVLRPAVLRAGLDDITFHGLRHSFVAIMVAAGCNVREVSEWAGRRRLPQRRDARRADQVHPHRPRLRRHLRNHRIRAVPAHRLRRQPHQGCPGGMPDGLRQLRGRMRGPCRHA